MLFMFWVQSFSVMQSLNNVPQLVKILILPLTMIYIFLELLGYIEIERFFRLH